ncbi:hypothetical protein Sspor_81140 [Streptomyces spororaveus]|uniref:Uncharacterized protein n=1 Tax=Streptomyces spororaveus TaxID=284039 RepID=A0ABQ3TQ75_9ACTN|nr:hypothetical protein Sspor_81140 [Streptomyces spororaveus]
MLVADAEEVAVDPDPQAGIHRVPGDGDEAGVERRLAADQLDLLGAQSDGLSMVRNQLSSLILPWPRVGPEPA